MSEVFWTFSWTRRIQIHIYDNSVLILQIYDYWNSTQTWEILPLTTIQFVINFPSTNYWWWWCTFVNLKWQLKEVASSSQHSGMGRMIFISWKLDLLGSPFPSVILKFVVTFHDSRFCCLHLLSKFSSIGKNRSDLEYWLDLCPCWLFPLYSFSFS